MASAADTSVSSPPTLELVKERIQHLLSTRANSPPSTTNHHIENQQACLSLTELCREYENHYNEPVPYEELGYDTLSRFLSSMKDIVRMDFSEWPAKCYLRRVTQRQANNKTTTEINERQFRAGPPIMYETIKRRIIWLLGQAAETNGSPSLTLKELCNQYAQKNDGQPLPFEQLGYSSLEDLLATMWDRIGVNGERCYLTPRNKDGHKKGKK